LLHDLVPKAKTIAMLQSAGSNLRLDAQLTGAREAAAALQLRLLEFTAGTDGEIEMVFASLVEQQAEALLVPTSPYFLSRAQKVVGLAAHYRIPAIYG
jgi:ABC-type uncharacterized transport system substrate-binding protein